MTTPRKELCCDFIDYLKKRMPHTVDLCEARDWESGAITTTQGAGNPSGSIIAIDDVAKSRVVDSFEGLVVALRDELIAGQTTFDQVCFETIAQVERRANSGTATTLFTFGRAQKFVSISLKYCYVWWFCFGKDSPKYGDMSWVGRWAPFFHVPVDNFTLKHFRGTPYEHIALTGSMVISWKWHLTRSRYCRVQDAVRHLARGSWDDSMHYEMDRIWVRPKASDET
jgi:hypothetical protein